jgi:hypothetical protein
MDLTNTSAVVDGRPSVRGLKINPMTITAMARFTGPGALGPARTA